MVDENIITEYLSFLDRKEFPCIGAKAARSRNHIKCLVVGHLDCPKDDTEILSFLYDFVDRYRKAKSSFHSAAIIFREPVLTDECTFDRSMWQRLISLDQLDKKQYQHDSRVSSNPANPHFGFSLKEEAFFIIALHPGSSRASRQFRYPTLVFNPHSEFEKLRKANRYHTMKKVVRKRDLVFSGSVNPMLNDFGESSEVYQYSGIQYDNEWKCPLARNAQSRVDHSTP